MARKSTKKTIETPKHDEAERKNIPTAGYQTMLAGEQESLISLAFERGAAGPGGDPGAVPGTGGH